MKNIILFLTAMLSVNLALAKDDINKIYKEVFLINEIVNIKDQEVTYQEVILFNKNDDMYVGYLENFLENKSIIRIRKKYSYIDNILKEYKGIDFYIIHKETKSFLFNPNEIKSGEAFLVYEGFRE